MRSFVGAASSGAFCGVFIATIMSHFIEWGAMQGSESELEEEAEPPGGGSREPDDKSITFSETCGQDGGGLEESTKGSPGDTLLAADAL